MLPCVRIAPCELYQNNNVMSTCGIIVLAYLAIGTLLALLWWHDEYEPQYKYEEEEGDGVEKPMAIMFLAMLVFFWPVKLIKNWIEGL